MPNKSTRRDQTRAGGPDDTRGAKTTGKKQEPKQEVRKEGKKPVFRSKSQDITRDSFARTR